MTRLVRFSNNAVSKLAGAITASSTTITLQAGDGSKFPTLTGSQFFMGTLVKSDGTIEVVKVTARTGDTLTVVRAAEAVAGVQTAYAFAINDRFEHRLTAKAVSDELDRLDQAALINPLNKSANYTITAQDVTSLVRVNTSGGAVTITLPDITTLTDDFDCIVAKVTGDNNVVTIARSGTDTINGATSYTLTSQWQGAWLTADRSTGTWTVIASGGSGVRAFVDTFTGTGTAGPFTLSGDPAVKENTAVYVGGVYQQKSTYTLVGTSLTLGGNVPAGVSVEVVWAQPLQLGVTSASLTTASDGSSGSLWTTVQGALDWMRAKFTTLASSAGSAAVGFIAAGAGAVSRWIQDKLRETVSVQDFGADPTGATDSTAAIQAAINYYGSGRGVVYFPPGTYKVTGPITVAKDRIHLIGAGSWATQILFAPTANGSCLVLSAGASVLFQGSVRGMTFYSTDSTYTKTAIEMVDTSGYWLDDIVVGGSVVAVPGSTFWSGGSGSRGIWNRGREACKQSRLYIYADKPIQISANPNNSISCDHFHFEDTYLAAANNPCMTIDSGVNVTNLTIDGYNPWVLGTDGLYWVDTTTSAVSQSINLKNIRWEQGQNAASWCVRIEHNTNLQGLLIENCQGGFERNGYKLRKVVGVTITNNINTGGSGRTVLDVDSSVLGISLNECQWQVSSTANMTGQHVVWSVPKNATGHPLPPTARYQSTTTSTNVGRQWESEMAQGGYQLTLANAAVANLGPSTMAGVLTIVDNEGISAQFLIRGTNITTNEIFDPVGVYSPTAGTASSTNVYWSAGNSRYEIQNLRGTSRNYKIVFVGSYTSF